MGRASSSYNRAANGYLSRSNAATSVNGTCASEVDNLRYLAFTR